MQRYIVTTSPGLEELLLEELQSFGIEAVGEAPGAVVFEGGPKEVARVIYGSRVASRILMSLKIFSARNESMLYDQIRRIDWAQYFAPEFTFAVFAHGSTNAPNGDRGMALSFATLKIKDAICDEIKKSGRERPNVDRKNPDIRIEALFHSGRCEVSLDLCGMPLHKRGYRLEGHEAPLKENRAAAFVRLSGYDGSRALVDPFCGSGTIVIEAAMSALGMSPFSLKKKEGLPGWKVFPELRDALEKEDEAAKAKLKDLKKLEFPISAFDSSNKALHQARANAERAGVSKYIHFAKANAVDLVSPHSFILTNPPHGERLEDTVGAAKLLSAFTQQVKHFCADSTLGLLLPVGELEKAVGFKPTRKVAFENSGIKCRFSIYSIFSGKRSKVLSETAK